MCSRHTDVLCRALHHVAAYTNLCKGVPTVDLHAKSKVKRVQSFCSTRKRLLREVQMKGSATAAGATTYKGLKSAEPTCDRQGE